MLEALKNGGKILIVLDNSVLNSYTHKEYREFIRLNYLIKAVFQLPTHTFVNQESGGITSILYLEKRNNQQQEQPPVFARVIENVGHNTAGKEESADDFDGVLKEYKRYEQEGKLYMDGDKSIKEYEHDNLFLISPERLKDRIDVYFHQPSYYKLLKTLKEKELHKKCVINKLADFQKIGIPKEDEEVDNTKQYRYIEISAIDKERGFIIPDGWDEGTREHLAKRAKLHIRENDVLFSKPFRSLKKVVIVPKELDKQLASSGFYGIRPKDYAEACLLWAILRSAIVQKQFFHLCSGYTQRELNEEYLNEYFLIPIPMDKDKIAKSIMQEIDKAKQARTKEINAINRILEAPTAILK